jgi:hypothetical protein
LPAKTADGWGAVTKESLLDLYAASWHPDWSGQIVFHLKPGHYVLADSSDASNDQKKKAFHLSAYDRESRIPLLIYRPGDPSPKKHTDPVNLQQVGSTLFSLLELEPPVGVTAPPLALPQGPPPKVIVTMVYDALPWSHWDDYLGQLPHHARLRAMSQEYTETRLGHMSSSTTVSHTVLATGQPPHLTGIPINHTRTGVGTYDEIFLDHKPDRLPVPTVADLHDIKHNSEPIIVSFCSQFRAAIAMAGHGTAHPGGDRDIVLWQRDRKMELATNPDLWAKPTYLDAISPQAMLARDTKLEFLGQPVTDERDIYLSQHNVFYGEWVIETIMDREPIGEDAITDLIFINHKALDNVAHRSGIEGPIYKAVLDGLDAFMGRFLDSLAARYGDDFVLILTSDHGFGPTLKRPRDREDPRRHDLAALLERLGTRLGSDQVVQDVQYLNGYLSDSALAGAGLSLDDVCSAFLAEDWILSCITKDEILDHRVRR